MPPTVQTFLVCALCALSARAQAPQYSVVDVITTANAGFPSITGINDNDQICGLAGGGGGNMWLYLPEPAFGLPAGVNTLSRPGTRFTPLAINNDGTIAGFLVLDSDDRNNRPFTWRDGVVEFSNHDLTGQEESGRYRAIAENGFLCGEVGLRMPPNTPQQDQVSYGLVRAPETELVLNPSEPWRAMVFEDINSAGKAVGFYNTPSGNQACIYDGSLQAIGVGRGPTWAETINEKGQVTGFLGSTGECFLYLPEADYGLPAGFNVIFFDGVGGGARINDSGQILTDTYLWDRGDVYPIESLLPESETREILFVRGFTNSSKILLGLLDRPSLVTTISLLVPAETGLVVNVDTDDPDADPDDGVIDTDLSTPGEQVSLRAAIDAANASAGADTITFDIDTAGVPEIMPATGLPVITDEVEIDATTQPGAGTVRIRGGGGAANGICVASAKAQLTGLTLTEFTGAAIDIDGGSDHVIEKCLIGTDGSGATGMGNGIGVRLENAFGTCIGGTDEENLNVISANAVALDIRKSDSVSVLANMIGTAPDGTTPLPNTNIGIFAHEVVHTVIGTAEMATPLDAKIGILLSDCVSDDGEPAVTVRGMNFNLDATGMQALGNTMEVGLRSVNCDQVCVGGGTPGSTMAEAMAGLNAFTGISGNAIELSACQNLEILGNLFGVPRHGLGRFPITGTGLLATNCSDLRVGTPAFSSPINARVGMKFSGISVGAGGVGALVQGINFNGDAAGMEKLGDTMEAGLCADNSERLCVGGGTPGSTMAETMAQLNAFTGISGNAIEIDRCIDPEVFANMMGMLRHGPGRFPIAGTGLVATNSSGMRVGTPAFSSPINARVGMKFSGITIGTNGIGALVQGINFNGDAAGVEKLGDTMEAGLCAEDSQGVTVGGELPGMANALVGIIGNGIEMVGMANSSIVGNRMGVAADGMTPIPNAGDNILVGGSGGLLSIFKNNLQSAGGAGVRVDGGMANTIIRQNRMIRNGRAIQRAIHDAAISAIGAMFGSTSVQGSVSGLPSDMLIMDFYAYDPMAPTPETDLYIGSTTVNLDSGGFGTYAALFPTTAPRGWMITSTATNDTQGTSELGPSSVIAPAPDTDRDGFPDTYELRYPECFDVNVPHPTDSDCDRDGRSDLEEFLAGTDPTRGDVPPVDRPVLSDSEVMVAIDAIAGRRYTMERFDGQGLWIPAGSRFIPIPGRVEFMDPQPPADGALYRFRIEVE